MTKNNQLKEIQKRLPENITVTDSTNFDFTDDEFLGILSSLKYFNNHYELNGKNELPKISYPVISKRLFLDFGLYISPSELENEKGKLVIYICSFDTKSLEKIIMSKNL